jgi:hypothetical protein
MVQIKYVNPSFAELLSDLPAIDDLAGIELIAADASVELIENKPGSQGSLKVYRYLLNEFGDIDANAANEGLRLYAEHTQDARLYPGKHPNIDRLLRISAEGGKLSGRLLLG